MNNLTISIYRNEVFTEIINEIDLFSKFEIKPYNDLNLCIKDSILNNQLIVFFLNEISKKDFEKIPKNYFPIIVINKNSKSKNILLDKFVEQLNMPFSILDLEKKIISLFSRHEFSKRSIINLQGYTIDKNERKIKKDNLELQLTEKEVNFLILFSKNNKPLSRNFVLKNVWNYSLKSETHTIETHIHRLRKKIFQKFNDDNFIKNNNKGYYI